MTVKKTPFGGFFLLTRDSCSYIHGTTERKIMTLHFQTEQVDFNKSVVETFDRTRGTLENLVNAVNNLQTQVDSLRERVGTLKEEIKELKDE